MGRLSAAIGRLVQSLFHPAAGQCQVYIDDVALMIRGSKELRNLQLAKFLYVLAAFGVQISKSEASKRVTWIGTTFQLHPNEVILGTPRKLVLEIQETLATWTGKGMIATRELRSFLGKLAWVSGIIPRLKWMVSALYAVLTKAFKEEASEEDRARKRPHDQGPKLGVVAVKRLGTTLPWLKTMFDNPDDLLIRQESLNEVEPNWGIVTDASPRGIGGMLIHNVNEEWHIVEEFEAPVQAHQATALEIQFMEASGQAVLEGLAVLRALQLWATKLQRAAVVIRSDSTVALAMSKKLASPTKTQSSDSSPGTTTHCWHPQQGSRLAFEIGRPWRNAEGTSTGQAPAHYCSFGAQPLSAATGYGRQPVEPIHATPKRGVRQFVKHPSRQK